MDVTVERKNGQKVAVVNSGLYLETPGDVLDLIGTVGGYYRCGGVLLRREFISPAIFDLKTGFAGEVMQKFVNYGVRLAVVGDFSDIKSKALKDFLYETNKGNHAFFLSTVEEALETLFHRGAGDEAQPPYNFVCYPGCSTCKKAQNWLEAQGIPFIFRDIKEECPTLSELRYWYALSGLPLKRFFNTSGLRYKELKLKDKLPTMSEEEQLELLASDGMLIKRPIIAAETLVLVGFKEAQWQERL